MPATTSRLSSPARRQALIIGAGKIGCGYLAPMFRQAGWDVSVACRTDEVAERMRAAGHYTVRITGGGGVQHVAVTPVVTGSAAFDRAVADADVIATAVGSGSITSLGGPLALALAGRGPLSPVDVWAVENSDVAPVLETAVRDAAARHGLALPPVGFASAIAYPAVTRGEWRTTRRPEFVSDTHRSLLVDASRLVQPVPRLPRVGATRRYAEQLQAKRFVFSAGHALCAFLGAHHGHTWVHEAALDPRVHALVGEALLASGRALHGPKTTPASVEGVLQRYANAELRDTVKRVARDPIRKLAPNGPLVGPARLVAETTGTVPGGFAAGIAAALTYRNPADAQSCLLGEMLRDGDVATVIEDVCGLDRDELPARQAMWLYRRWSRDEVRRPAPLALAA